MRVGSGLEVGGAGTERGGYDLLPRAAVEIAFVIETDVARIGLHPNPGGDSGACPAGFHRRWS